VSNSTMISHAAADEAICKAVSLFMGRGRAHSVEDVAIGTGIPARTLSAMIASGGDRRCPSGPNLLLLASFFGVTFTDRVLGCIGQGARDLDPAADAPAVIVATLMQGAAEFAKAGADGQFCHRDRGELADDAAMMIQILEPFTAPKHN
jgi:hypothetical protein